ncbi:hypothetical protein ACLOJK_015125 [Asimina triloba]
MDCYCRMWIAVFRPTHIGLLVVCGLDWGCPCSTTAIDLGLHDCYSGMLGLDFERLDLLPIALLPVATRGYHRSMMLKPAPVSYRFGFRWLPRFAGDVAVDGGEEIVGFGEDDCFGHLRDLKI